MCELHIRVCFIINVVLFCLFLCLFVVAFSTVDVNTHSLFLGSNNCSLFRAQKRVKCNTET